MNERLRNVLDRRRGYLMAVILVAATTAAFVPVRLYFAKGQWALFYLLVIVLTAGLGGVRPALLSAVLAFFAWNYFFLPPFHTFTIDDPKDWLALFAFLIVGVAVGLQTGRMRDREADAVARERDMAFLNEFSAHLVSDATVPDMADLLFREVTRATGAGSVVLFVTDESGALREVETPSQPVVNLDSSVAGLARWVSRESKALGLPMPAHRSRMGRSGWPVTVGFEKAEIGGQRRDAFIPLQTALRQEGVLYIGEPTDGGAYTSRNAELMVAVANQAAAFLERKHLQSVAVQADALREADRLKSTFISSISHELKTPLASVTATVSNLLQQDIEWDSAKAHEELEAVEEDLQRLNSSIGALLDLSRLEAASWESKKDSYEFGEIVGTALSKIPQKLRSRISFAIPDDFPQIFVDFPQWARVLRNLLENALVYAPADTPVRVGAEATPTELRMWVEDEGPGIPSEDRERIFEKFYRGETSAKVPSGTGLGLAVTREIVRFHGGRIWVEEVAPHGARMVVSLPREVADGGA